MLPFVGWLLDPDSMEEIKIMPLVKFDGCIFFSLSLRLFVYRICYTCAVLRCFGIEYVSSLEKLNVWTVKICIFYRKTEFIVHKKYTKRTISGEIRKKRKTFYTKLLLSLRSHYSAISLSSHHITAHVNTIRLFVQTMRFFSSKYFE